MKGFWPGKMEGIKSMVPADFLIGPDLTVQAAYDGNDMGDHLPIEKIYHWLDNPGFGKSFDQQKHYFY